jgi:hypothetical protein
MHGFARFLRRRDKIAPHNVAWRGEERSLIWQMITATSEKAQPAMRIISRRLTGASANPAVVAEEAITAAGAEVTATEAAVDVWFFWQSLFS